MIEAIGRAVEAVIKIGIPIYVAVLICTSLLLFLPDSFAQHLGIIEFRQLYRGYIGGAMLASASLLVAQGLYLGAGLVTNRLDNRRLRLRTLDTLSMLTEDEKVFLRPFIVSGENTIHRPVNDGVAGGLIAKHIVYRASNLVGYFNTPYNLQPIARKVLTEMPSLIQ